jgi:hypothetical protein
MGELCQKILFTIKKRKTMKKNEAIIQKTIESLDEIFDYLMLNEESNMNEKSHFDMIQDSISNISMAGSLLAENLIISVDSKTLNISNWYDVLVDSLNCDSDDVFQFTLHKLNLEETDLHCEVFNQGFDSLYDSLRDILDYSTFSYTNENVTESEKEYRFLEYFIDMEQGEGGENENFLWDRFLSYVVGNAENLLVGKIDVYNDEEYLSQFEEQK